MPHLSEIDAIFFHYDAEKVKAADGEAFTAALRRIRCGNRSVAAPKCAGCPIREFCGG